MHKRHSTSRQWTRIFVLYFPVAFFFTVHAAFAGTPRDILEGEFLPPPPDGVIQLEADETIVFGNDEATIYIDAPNLTLRGGTSSGFSGTIGTLADTINTQKNSLILELEDFQKTVAAERSGFTSYDSLSEIRSDGNATRNEASTQPLNDNNKWLTTRSTSPSAANGFSLEDIRFGNINIEYGNGSGDKKFVNGLIGNNHLAGAETTMGHITGNVFETIDVKLMNDNDQNYLAGGGVVGVRSTGNTAEITTVSGNIFDGIDILTTNTTELSASPNGVLDDESTYLEGGGLVGVNGVSSPADAEGHALLNELSNNFFTGINIGSNDILLGGGLIGVNNNSKKTDSAITFSRLGTASGNIFGSGADNDGAGNDITVTIDNSIRGGGVIGVNGLSSATAELVTLEKNAFAGILVETGSYIKGGGIVGLQTNGVEDKDDLSDPDPKEPAQATLGTATGNLFLKQTVTAKDYIEGGGVIGLRSNEGMAHLGTLGDNVFSEIAVTTNSTLHGGGIVGLHGLSDIDDVTTTLETASRNFFLNQTIKAGSHIEGGGVIGLRSNEGVAELETLTDNVFRGIVVNSGEHDTISGGGVVGLSAAAQALMGQVGGVKNNTFDNIHVTAGEEWETGDPVNYLNGGGIIGVHARNATPETLNWATMEGIEGNSFTDLHVKATSLNGGGIVGVNAGGAPDENSVAGLAALGKITGNIFDNLEITTVGADVDTGHLEGGGVIGVWNKDDGLTFDNGVSAIDEVTGNKFTNIKVTTGTYLQGGGIIGMRGNALMRIEAITNDIFMANTIEALNGYIDGGGIIGVTSRDGSNPTAGIGLIGDSVFEKNNISAGEDVLGGIVYTYGLDDGMTIQNSQFLNNTFTSTNGIVYGAVTVDTGALPTTGNTLTLTADSGMSTIFQNNQIIDNVEDIFDANHWDVPRLASNRTNSLYFGTINEASDDNGDGIVTDPAEWSPTLVVNPLAGGTVALYDPIWVNQADPQYDPGDGSNPDDANDYGFDMNVRGGGDFIWGGTNVFTLDTATPSVSGETGTSGTVTLEAGSTTTLLDKVSTTTYLNNIQITGDHVKTMILDAPNFMFALENGGTLNVEGHNQFDLSGYHANATEPVASLEGTLNFNLNNTAIYHRGEVPGDSNHLLSDDVSDASDRLTAGSTPLLTIKAPAGDGQVDVSGSTVRLSDFNGGATPMPGDRFYLVEVLNGGTKGDPANKAISGDPVNGTATASHGLTNYTFIIDRNLDNGGAEEETRFLVARLASIDPGAEAPPVATVRVPGISFLQKTNDWLMGIPFYEFAPLDDEPHDPCAPCDPCDICNPPLSSGRNVAARTQSDWVYSSFAETKGTWFRANADSRTHADVRGVVGMAGVTAQKRVHNGSIHFGVFADIGSANYDTHNFVLDEGVPRTIRGNGDIENAGGGLAFRRKWNSGLRLDAMLHAGGHRNRFTSHDLTGESTRFTLRSAYMGASIGLDYGWAFRKSDFNVYGRYSWLMDRGGKTTLSSGWVVDFNATHSHRTTVGGRWTWNWTPNLSSYVGAAYEYELDSKVRLIDRTTQHNLEYDGVGMSGGTGIGEIGLSYRRNDKLTVTAGVEGYVGKREGIGAFLSAAWRW